MGDDKFLGRGWAFPPEFDSLTKQNRMVEEEVDIWQSLRILLETNPGERIMQPGFGCGIRRYVFESFDESISTEMKEAIRIAILFYETRIIVERIEIKPSPEQNHVLKIEINFKIRATNTRSNMVFPFYLDEGTSISENEQ